MEMESQEIRQLKQKVQRLEDKLAKTNGKDSQAQLPQQSHRSAQSAYNDRSMHQYLPEGKSYAGDMLEKVMDKMTQMYTAGMLYFNAMAESVRELKSLYGMKPAYGTETANDPAYQKNTKVNYDGNKQG